MNVRDAMTPDPITVTPSTPLGDVAHLLFERRISGVPVVDETGTVLGVISEGDFLVKETQGADVHRTLWSRLFGRQDHSDVAVATTAGALMTSPPVTIDAGCTLHAAAAVMARRHVNRLPVVQDGRLVGILTRADVVHAFARSDGELAEDVTTAIRAVDGVRLVGVVDGVVAIAGTVPDREMATALRATVCSIDGVLAVDDRGVAWPDQAPESDSLAWRAREDYRDE